MQSFYYSFYFFVEFFEYENFDSIPLRDYDKLRERQSYITDKSLVGIIDKLEELVRALRKHKVRTYVD